MVPDEEDRSFKLDAAGNPVTGGFIPAEYKPNSNVQFNSNQRQGPMANQGNNTRDSGMPNGLVQQSSSGPACVLITANLIGSAFDVLIDTGASINLVNAEKFFKMRPLPDVRQYTGRVESADGTPIGVVGKATIKTKIGALEQDVEYLIVYDIKPPVILGLPFMMQHGCSIDLHSKQFWAGPTESFTVPIRLQGLNQFKSVGAREKESEQAKNVTEMKVTETSSAETETPAAQTVPATSGESRESVVKTIL